MGNTLSRNLENRGGPNKKTNLASVSLPDARESYLGEMGNTAGRGTELGDDTTRLPLSNAVGKEMSQPPGDHVPKVLALRSGVFRGHYWRTAAETNKMGTLIGKRRAPQTTSDSSTEIW